ncbi:MAG: hypothetical protein OXK17_09325 [Thaumarchaeota archaeon]|nr:hypothetical protein [Nitrososphaerota archaeon]
MKICNQCNAEKPPHMFSREMSCGDVTRPVCKACVKQQYNKAYYAKHKEALNEQNRKRWRENKERYAEGHAQWWEEHGEEQREKVRERGKIRRQQEKTDLFGLFGYDACKQCGFADMDSLQFHHIHNDGHKDKKLHRGHHISYYLKNPQQAKDKLQILCANCNNKKDRQLRRTGGEQ